MKKFIVITTALMASTALASMPALAADSTADLAKQIQMLQDQLKSMQQQLDTVKANEAKAASGGATSSDGKPVPHVTESGAHKMSIESADGQYSIGLTGRVMFDVGDYVHFKNDSAVVGIKHLSSGVNARRARIGVSGKVFGDWTYAFIYDGGNSTNSTAAGVQTAQVTYNGFKNVIIDLPGYSEPPFTMETAMSSNDIVFMERATPSNLAAGLNASDFRANTGVRFIDDRYWIGAYLTGPAIGDSHSNLHERFGAFQRASAQVLTGPDYTVHLGVAIDELLQAPDTGVGTAKAITLSDRPELRVDPTAILSTGSLGSVANPVKSAFVYNVEAAATYESLFVQGEYDRYSVHRTGLANANFDGWYVMAAYTLTGEHRNYNRATGAYGSITPAHPVSLKTGDIGAWEVAARVSYANLTDNFIAGTSLAAQPNAVDGGKQTNYSLGVNWYLNTYMRIMVNYIHSDFKKLNGTAVAGAPLGAGVGDKFDAVAARFQLNW